MLIAFNKPYNVLSQFTRELPTHRTLADYGFPPDVYAIGRLDQDSEGLLLLSDEASWTHNLLPPKRGHPRTYHAQVEGHVEAQTLEKLGQGGIDIKGHLTLPCSAEVVEPVYPPRVPPIRKRQSIPTTWLQLTLTEGKNRQVRRMTAAIGHPTLRLIRAAIGNLTLAKMALEPGEWRMLGQNEMRLVLMK